MGEADDARPCGPRRRCTTRHGTPSRTSRYSAPWAGRRRGAADAAARDAGDPGCARHDEPREGAEGRRLGSSRRAPGWPTGSGLSSAMRQHRRRPVARRTASRPRARAPRPWIRTVKQQTPARARAEILCVKTPAPARSSSSSARPGSRHVAEILPALANAAQNRGARPARHSSRGPRLEHRLRHRGAALGAAAASGLWARLVGPAAPASPLDTSTGRDLEPGHAGPVAYDARVVDALHGLLIPRARRWPCARPSQAALRRGDPDDAGCDSRAGGHQHSVSHPLRLARWRSTARVQVEPDPSLPAGQPVRDEGPRVTKLRPVTRIALALEDRSAAPASRTGCACVRRETRRRSPQPSTATPALSSPQEQREHSTRSVSSPCPAGRRSRRPRAAVVEGSLGLAGPGRAALAGPLQRHGRRRAAGLGESPPERRRTRSCSECGPPTTSSGT